jgi:hypothetical protein
MSYNGDDPAAAGSSVVASKRRWRSPKHDRALAEK